LTKQRIPLDVWVFTSALGLTFGFSVSAALVERAQTLALLGTISGGVALAIWFVMVVRHLHPIAALAARLEQGQDLSGLKAHPGTPGSLIAGKLLEARADQARTLETCYSLAAVMGHATHAIGEAKDQILKSISSLSGDCSEIGGILAGLRSQTALGPAGEPEGLQPSGPGRAAYEIGSAIDEVVSTADEMSQVIVQMHHDAKDLVGSVDETAYSVSRLDSFLQDMTRSGKDLETSTENANRVALEGTKAFGDLERENEALIVSVKEAGAAVDDLGRWSEEVGKIIEVIQDITDETNLLALNAAIIAAQSGEHGKAFGVVAEEIRGLAERTSSSTKEISDLVKAVQKNVSNVAQSMKKSLQSVERGEVLAQNAGRVLEKVSESFEASRNLAREMAASTFEHRLDSTSVVKLVHKVTDIARRLETNDIKDPKAGTAGVLSARVLGTLARCEGARPAARAEAGGKGRDERSGTCSVGIEDRGIATAQTIDRSEVLLQKVKFSLDSIGEKVVASIGTIEQVAALTRSLVKTTFKGDGRIAGRCWELVGCAEDLRTRCQAYREGDWRCFLIDDVACSLDNSSDVHGGRRCYDCPAFRSNLRRLLGGVEDAAD
jgi:methyl-accepting chemotaxis protein